jgi:hypothetical protein
VKPFFSGKNPKNPNPNEFFPGHNPKSPNSKLQMSFFWIKPKKHELKLFYSKKKPKNPNQEPKIFGFGFFEFFLKENIALNRKTQINFFLEITQKNQNRTNFFLERTQKTQTQTNFFRT